MTAEEGAATLAAPVERVAIVGAGIAGLSLAHALRSAHIRDEGGDENANGNADPIQIDIFDARSDLDEKSGSGIQLTGGMAALRRISPDLQRSVSEASLPFERVVSRCRPWFGSDDGGWKLLELDIRQAIRDEAAAAADAAASAREENDGRKEKGECELVTEEGEVLAYTILRGTLQRILLDTLASEHGVEVKFGKRLCGLSRSDSDDDLAPAGGGGEGILCRFADGSIAGPYDLVVGCDGIKSAVKEFVNTGEIASPSSSSPSSSALYSGLRITFAIQENAADDDAGAPRGCQFTQFFGDGAYALTSSYGTGKGKPPAKGAFLVYPDENYIGPFPKSRSDDKRDDSVGSASTVSAAPPAVAVPLDENADWTQDSRVTRDHVTECLNVLRSASIPDNDVADIIRKSDRFFDLGVYLHNPFSLNGWLREVRPRSSTSGGLLGGITGAKKQKTTKYYAITTGDASHSMPPFLGQGANQALQDSYSLASKIHEYNSQVQQLPDINDPSSSVPDLKALLKEYENRRWLPTTSITAKAAFLGYLEVGPSIFANFRDAFFFVMGKIGVAKKVFLDAATPKM